MESAAKVKQRKFQLPVRFTLPVLGFLAYCLISAMRLNMSITIVAMVNATAVYANHGDAGNDSVSDTEYKEEDGEFIWSPKKQSYILGATYYIAGFGSIIGGRMAEILGSKRVFGFGMLVFSILTIATPACARFHWYALVAIRVVVGFLQGFLFPTFSPLVRRWIPVPERSLVSSIIFSGLHFGSFFTILVSGYLCKSEFLGGWPSVYYIFGVAGCLWCLLVKYLIYETPTDHPWISDAEMNYILENNQSPNEKCCCFSVTTNSLEMYVALSSSLGCDDMFLCCVLGSVSLLHRPSYVHGYHSQVSNGKGMLGYVACIFGVIAAEYDIMWNTSMLIIAMGFTGIAYIAEMVTPLDMSPHFSANYGSVEDNILHLDRRRHLLHTVL